jgi:SAM-dependent methyltransferase
MINNIYNRNPLFIRNNIPFFSDFNEYINNYEQIAKDQLNEIQKTGSNPFIPEYLWIEYENSTANLIKKYTKPSMRILDVGVGLGRILSQFPNLQRYGMDICLDFLKISQSKGIEVCFSLIEDMPYSPEMFDIIICTDVLEHVIDVNLCCEKMLAILKPGGFLIIRTPYREPLNGYLMKEYPYKFAHLRTFDEFSLQLLFTRIIKNCEIIEYQFVGNEQYLNRLKCFFLLPGEEKFFYWYLDIMKKYRYNDYQSLLKKFYWPIEINVVVQRMK